MTDIVILDCLSHLSGRLLSKLVTSFVVKAFNVELVLSGVGIDLLGHDVVTSLFVRVVQELDLLQDLETRHSDTLELVDAYCLLWWLVIEGNSLGLSVILANILLGILIVQHTVFPVCELFLVDNHNF